MSASVVGIGLSAYPSLRNSLLKWHLCVKLSAYPVGIPCRHTLSAYLVGILKKPPTVTVHARMTQGHIFPKQSSIDGVLTALDKRVLWADGGSVRENRGQLLCAGAVLRACHLRHSAALWLGRSLSTEKQI